jgi:Matrixin
VRTRKHVLPLAVFGAVSALSAASFGFCRTTTCRDCGTSAEDGCVHGGAPLFWPNRCVSHSLQQDGTKWASLAETTRAVNGAFEAWSQVTCPGTSEHPSIDLVDIGPVACGAQEYNNGVVNVAGDDATIGGNANIVVFNDDSWDVSDPDGDPEATLALTTVTYDLRTGELLDADIRVNGQNVLSTSTPVPANAYDIQSVLTHEVGHFIGLAHSTAPYVPGHGWPTMRAVYPKGDDTFRTLEPDDIAGVCASYPPGRAADPSCVPHFGFSAECGIELHQGAGCELARRPAAFSDGLAVLLGAVGAAARRRSRSRRRARNAQGPIPPCPTRA